MTGRVDPPYPINDMTTDDPGALRETADLAIRVAVSLDGELREAQDRIAAVLALHIPSPVALVCGSRVCGHCMYEWPCADARTLGVES